MARGWESKDVESRQEMAEQERREREAFDPAQQQEGRACLMLDRTRVRRELDSTTHPRRRQQLEAALAHLDRQLAELDRAR